MRHRALTETQRNEVRAQRKRGGITLASLATIYGVSVSTIHDAAYPKRRPKQPRSPWFAEVLARLERIEMKLEKYKTEDRNL